MLMRVVCTGTINTTTCVTMVMVRSQQHMGVWARQVQTETIRSQNGKAPIVAN